jgi:hypothetical protein
MVSGPGSIPANVGPGVPVTLRQGSRVIEDSRRLLRVV